ncbi:MAG: hypothetical protein CMJ62_03780 [Planctomycetaceae bacterium]|nr:hypothetical protein [Planctomycetaceae bacterium]
MEEDTSHDQLVWQVSGMGQAREVACGTYLEKAEDAPEALARGGKWFIVESEIGRLAAARRQIARQAGRIERSFPAKEKALLGPVLGSPNSSRPHRGKLQVALQPGKPPKRGDLFSATACQPAVRCSCTSPFSGKNHLNLPDIPYVPQNQIFFAWKDRESLTFHGPLEFVVIRFRRIECGMVLHAFLPFLTSSTITTYGVKL